MITLNKMLSFKEIPNSYENKLVNINSVSNYFKSNNSLLNAYKNYSNFGVFKDKDLLAFIFYRVVIDEAEIIHIVCDKKHQGNGYAYSLLTHFISVIKKDKIKNCYLEVGANNKSAQILYNSTGFKQVGRRKSYYNNEDAIIMRLYCN